MTSGEDLFELAIAGVVLILMGSVLAPILPFDVAAIGWFILLLVTAASIAIVVILLAQVVETLGG